MQKTKIRQYCALHEMELLEVISDERISGKSIKARPGIQDVLELVRKREIDAVVVYKLDRLARNTIETLEMVQGMDKKGVALHSITENLDTQSSIGRFVVRTLASLAEMERDQISERTSAALQQKKEKSERISGRAPYGYRFEEGKVVPYGKEQVTIRKIRGLSDTGHSVRKIRHILASEETPVLNRNGKPFGLAALHKILKAA